MVVQAICRPAETAIGWHSWRMPLEKRETAASLPLHVREVGEDLHQSLQCRRVPTPSGEVMLNGWELVKNWLAPGEEDRMQKHSPCMSSDIGAIGGAGIGMPLMAGRASPWGRPWRWKLWSERTRTQSPQRRCPRRRRHPPR